MGFLRKNRMAMRAVNDSQAMRFKGACLISSVRVLYKLGSP